MAVTELKNIAAICPTRDESDAMKGIFILLIVMAHNTLLVPTSSAFQNYFYQFHYFSFFILPFFYPSKRLTLKRVGDYFVRFYVPYIWLFGFCSVVFLGYVNLAAFSLNKWLSAFVGGDMGAIKEVTGVRFLWFLPAFFIFSLLRDWFSLSGLPVKVLLFLVTLFIHFSSYWGLVSYAELRTLIPMGISQALFLFPMGVIAKSVVEIPQYNNRLYLIFAKYWINLIVAVSVFTLLSILFFEDGGLGAESWSGEIRNIFLAVFFFLIVYTIRKQIARNRLFQYLGYYSLEIYLFHVFIYNGLMFGFFRYHFPTNILTGVLVLLLTLTISIFVIYVLRKITFAQKILFPKELIALKDVLK